MSKRRGAEKRLSNRPREGRHKLADRPIESVAEAAMEITASYVGEVPQQKEAWDAGWLRRKEQQRNTPQRRNQEEAKEGKGGKGGKRALPQGELTSGANNVKLISISISANVLTSKIAGFGARNSHTQS